jgi:hypothetical protein
VLQIGIVKSQYRKFFETELPIPFQSWAQAAHVVERPVAQIERISLLGGPRGPRIPAGDAN